jgi:glycosyltransferase involved in cell wall biosynthesis
MTDVSIITASYNKARFISETIQSVISQTHLSIEHIIVDDASTDQTVPVVRQLAEKDKRIKLLVNEINMGGNYSRNKGLKAATGEYVIFLDADDLLIASCVKERLRVAKENPSKNLLVFSMGVFHNEPGDDKRTWLPSSQTPLKDFLAHRLPWSILQPFWKKDFLIQLGGFDESFQRLQDVELNTRALLHKNIEPKIIGGEPDCFYRIDDKRRNYDVYNFDLKRVEASLQYFSKYYIIAAERGLESSLYGTIYHAYLQLMFDRRHNRIAKKEFTELEKKLLTPKIIKRLSKKLLFKLAKTYNLYFPRIRGCNFLLNKFITS